MSNALHTKQKRRNASDARKSVFRCVRSTSREADEKRAIEVLLLKAFARRASMRRDEKRRRGEKGIKDKRRRKEKIREENQRQKEKKREDKRRARKIEKSGEERGGREEKRRDE